MNVRNTSSLPLILLGSGGHAKVLLALAQAAGLTVQGVCDPFLAEQAVLEWRGIPVLGGDDTLNAIDPSTVGMINGIGQLVRSDVRRRIYERLRTKGFSFPSLIHPTAWVAATTQLGEGVQIMAGVIIQPDCSVGENTILNTRASIDHDCRIGAHVHVAPAATLCGGVIVEDSGFIGSGATVIQGLRVGEGAVVGAGVALVRDLIRGNTILGAPLRQLTQMTPSEAS